MNDTPLHDYSDYDPEARILGSHETFETDGFDIRDAAEDAALNRLVDEDSTRVPLGPEAPLSARRDSASSQSEYEDHAASLGNSSRPLAASESAGVLDQPDSGTCIWCGCSETAIKHFRWLCASTPSTLPSGLHRLRPSLPVHSTSHKEPAMSQTATPRGLVLHGPFQLFEPGGRVAQQVGDQVVYSTKAAIWNRGAEIKSISFVVQGIDANGFELVYERYGDELSPNERKTVSRSGGMISRLLFAEIVEWRFRDVTSE